MTENNFCETCGGKGYKEVVREMEYNGAPAEGVFAENCRDCRGSGKQQQG